MERTFIDKLKWRVGKWFWTPPGEMPPPDPKDAEWIRPKGKPVKNKRWRKALRGKGAPAPQIRPIDEFYHRGGYERHEARSRHDPKAVMGFRGKGAKVERRSARSRAKRRQGG